MTPTSLALCREWRQCVAVTPMYPSSEEQCRKYITEFLNLCNAKAWRDLFPLLHHDIFKFQLKHMHIYLWLFFFYKHSNDNSGGNT